VSPICLSDIPTARGFLYLAVVLAAKMLKLAEGEADTPEPDDATGASEGRRSSWFEWPTGIAAECLRN
jgi:hypothetical protein